MKIYKKIISFVAVLVFSLSVVQISLAAPDINKFTGNIANKSGFDQDVSTTTLSETIGRIIKIVLSFTATIFLALTVYAGFLWMTAGGNDEKVSKATQILYTSVIGLIIVFAAYGITVFVMWAVFGSATGQKTCPWGPGTNC